MPLNRIIIRPNDIVNILGIKYPSAASLICTIKAALKKEKRHRLTIKEFCDYEGLPEQEVVQKLEKCCPL